MLRQLRERLGRKMRPDRIILQLRAELIPDLLVNRVNDFLAGKHGQTLLLIAPMQKQPVGEGWRNWSWYGLLTHRAVLQNLLAKSTRSLYRHSAIDTPNAFAGSQPSLR